jgi:hypothetical protein
MSRVGFEPTTPVFEQAKTVHALDRAATVVGFMAIERNKLKICCGVGGFHTGEYEKYYLLGCDAV